MAAAAAGVAAGAVAEGKRPEPEPGLPELHVLSCFRDVDDESRIDIMDRDFGAVLVVTFFDGDEDRLVGRLGGDVGVDRRRQRRRLQREDDALSKNFFKKNSSKNFLDHFSTSQVSRFLSRSIQSNIFLKKTKKSQLAAKEKTNSSFFQSYIFVFCASTVAASRLHSKKQKCELKKLTDWTSRGKNFLLGAIIIWSCARAAAADGSHGSVGVCR